MMILKPTTANIANALAFMNEYSNKGYGKNVLGVSHSEYLSFIRIGKLCELVFADYLTQKKIAFVSPDMLTPHPGEHKKGADLILSHTNQEVDIKAANKPFHIRILIREDQFQAHIHEIYIGAKYINDNSIEYHGYIMGSELSAIPPKDFGYGPCRYMLLNSLKPIERFIELALNNKKIE
jgi:hypothetical protein